MTCIFDKTTNATKPSSPHTYEVEWYFEWLNLKRPRLRSPIASIACSLGEDGPHSDQNLPSKYISLFPRTWRVSVFFYLFIYYLSHVSWSQVSRTPHTAIVWIPILLGEASTAHHLCDFWFPNPEAYRKTWERTLALWEEQTFVGVPCF